MTPEELRTAVDDFVHEATGDKATDVLYKLLKWFGVDDSAGRGLPERQATVATVPGDGWSVVYKNEDGTHFSVPVVCWRVQIDGTIIPVTCDPTGLAMDEDATNVVLYRHKNFKTTQLTEDEKTLLKVQPEYEFEKNLVASTVHITKQDNYRLQNKASVHVTAYELGSYGFLIYCGNDEAVHAAALDNYSVAFSKLLTRGRELGCQYIHLDRDGPVYPELEKFDW